MLNLTGRIPRALPTPDGAESLIIDIYVHRRIIENSVNIPDMGTYFENVPFCKFDPSENIHELKIRFSEQRNENRKPNNLSFAKFNAVGGKCAGIWNVIILQMNFPTNHESQFLYRKICGTWRISYFSSVFYQTYGLFHLKQAHLVIIYYILLIYIIC